MRIFEVVETDFAYTNLILKEKNKKFRFFRKIY